MTGIVSIGTRLNRQASNVHGNAAGLESARRREGEMAEAAEDEQAMSMAATGAGIGMQMGAGAGPIGMIGGALAGGIGGWLGSKVF